MPQERIYGPGERIGPFKVVRLLGSGALGTVYEARPHPEECEELVMLGVQRVAVKVARLDALARTAEQRRRMVERLEREYQTLLKLGNPGCPYLPYVYELGWHDRTPFLVMELVDGPTLEDVLSLQPPMRSMLEVFQKLCAAVAILHGRGVVHRDINPSNVLIRGEEPLLIDFSHCLPATGHRITGANELVGTLLYASPQADGYALFPESEQPYLATTRDDVWGLGVVLYRMLTGDVPWRSPPQHREALVREMLQGPPRHPSEVNPQVPRALGDVALMLLQPDPALRPRDAIAVLEVLEPALRTSAVEGQVPTARPRATPPGAGFQSALPAAKARPAWGRGRKILAVAATVLLVLGLDVAGRMGVEAVRRVVGRATQTSALGGAKASLPSALPVPPEPLPGQMRAPCPKQYVEESGGCWDEIQALTPEGKPRSSCPDNINIDRLREKKEKDGRLRCLVAVMRPTPSAEEPEKGKR